MLRGRQRNFLADAEAFLNGLHPPLIIEGTQHIPPGRACVFTPNHYSRPGFSAMWIGIAMTAAAARNIQWVMTSAWVHPNPAANRIWHPASRLVLGRIAAMYGFISVPPIPLQSAENDRRLRAVRQVITFVRENPNCDLGLAPEGMDMPSGELGMPPHGTGKLLTYLCRIGMWIVPAAIFEQNGCLNVRFGEAYTVSNIENNSPGEMDLQVRENCMQAIARLLPEK
jgi:hypothetical protein